MDDSYDAYALLGVSKESTPAEIKEKYRSIMLSIHPDKCANTNTSYATQTESDNTNTLDGNRNDCTSERISKLMTARDTLCDPVKRKAHNVHLEKNTINYSSYPQIDLSDFTESADCECDVINPAQKVYSYSCRCGDIYVVTDDDIAGCSNILVPCGSCSLNININIPS